MTSEINKKDAVVYGDSQSYLFSGVLMFVLVAYIFSKSIIVSICAGVLAVVIYRYNRKHKIVFTYDEGLSIIKPFRKKVFLSYNEIETVDFYKYWQTTPGYMLVTLYLNDSKKKLKFDISEPSTGSRIAHIARYNNVNCTFNDDYTEMIIENGVSKIGKDSL